MHGIGNALDLFLQRFIELPQRHHSPRMSQTPSDILLQTVPATSSSVWLPSSCTYPGQPYHQNQRVIISPTVTFQNAVRRSLRGFPRGKTFGKVTAHPIRDK